MNVALLLILLATAPFVAAATSALLAAPLRNVATALAAGVALLGFVVTLSLYPRVVDGGVVSHVIPWIPSLGLDLVLRMDGFTWMFSALITGIGFLVTIYARYYMSPEDSIPRFFSFLLAFMGAMLGVVLSGNLIQLAFFWEMTTLFSFLLISYWRQNAAARDGARLALTITAIGGLCLLLGFLIIGHIVGSYDLDAVLASGEAIREHRLYHAALVFVLLGALTKSAQFPFQFWLPGAMAAPTPVSAYLHSATMVKLGVFILALLWPVMAGTWAWFTIVTSAGLLTLLVGAYSAVFQQDLKGLLAYSTISHLGLITLLLGLSSPLAAVAAIFHIMNHATFKASLFMAAGIIDHETGTRDMRRLSGLFRFMPITATLAMVAAAAMAGVPLLNGFLSKEMFFAEAVATHADSLLDASLPYVATLAGAFSVIYSLRFIQGVFFGPPPRDLPREPHEPPHWMRFPIELLVLACLVVGVAPGLTVGPFLHAAVTGVLGARTPEYSLALWHGFNLPLLMSVIAIVGGVLGYLALRGHLARGIDGPPLVRHLKGQRIFERILVTISWKWARALEAFLGTRRLQTQVGALLLIALFSGFLASGASVDALELRWNGIEPVFALIWIAGAACAIGAAQQAKFHRLAALVLMSGAGLATVLTFAWFSAPDLAITQLLVEVVTTVLILLGLRWMPKRLPEVHADVRPPWRVRLRRSRDLAIACLVGVAMAAISYAIMTRPPADTIARNFIERAYTEGGGTNIVNVILVDFRGFDTFGEIAVVGVVALTVFALLRRFRPAPESLGQPEQQRVQNAYDDATTGREPGDTVAEYLWIPAIIMHWLFPVVIVFAVYLFMRGHDLPGGGFAAGVAMSIAFLLQYMAGGARWVEDRLRVLPVKWIAAGLLTAAATGLGSLAFGYPFLTSYFQYTQIPLIGKVPTATALLFDLGVFALVVGATVLILVALAHQSLRGQKARSLDGEAR